MLEADDEGFRGVPEPAGDVALWVVLVIARKKLLEFGDLASCCRVIVSVLEVTSELRAVGAGRRTSRWDVAGLSRGDEGESE